MICASVQIPVSYLGTHLSGGSTRASALVGTEPVTKRFESRQLVYQKILQTMWDRINPGVDCEITFPELITQDRSQKIKDLILAKDEKVISKEYMCNTIASELGYTSYDFDTEQAKIKQEEAEELDSSTDSILIAPLAPIPPASPGATDKPGTVTMPKPSAITAPEKKQIAKNNGA